MCRTRAESRAKSGGEKAIASDGKNLHLKNKYMYIILINFMQFCNYREKMYTHCIHVHVHVQKWTIEP